MYNLDPSSEHDNLPAPVPPASTPPAPIPPASVSPGGPYRPGGELQRPTFYIKMSKPIVSRVIMGVLLATFLIEVVYGVVRYGSWMTFSGANIYMLVDLGAKVNAYIAAGDVWRLFTATLLHDGILHLLFNLYALFALGPMLEAYIGPVRFACIYILGGLFGSLLSYAFSDSISVGASGAIFGIIGATTVYFFRYRDNFGAQGKAILQNMVVVIIINLVFGLSSGYIDNWGHIGGLLGGALVAIGLVPRYQSPTVVRLGEQPLEEVKRRQWETLWVVGCTIIFIGGVMLVTYKYTHTIWGIIG